MKKRVLALLLAGMLALSVTACGGGDSASATDSPVQTEAEAPAETPEEPEAAAETEPAEEEDVFEKALENARGVESMELQMAMDMSMQASQDGEEQSADFVMTMDMACINDPFKLKMETVVDAGEESATISIYGDVAEDGTATIYMNDGSGWQSQAVGKTDLVQYDASANMLGSIDTGAEYTADGMEEVDGANAYKYAHTMSGDEAKEAILTSGALDSLTSAGIDPSQFESAMGDVGDLTEYIWIDEATLYPVKYEIDMTEVMSAMMDSIVESMGDEAEGISMSISKMKMTMTFSNFNNVEDFEIPAKESAD